MADKIFYIAAILHWGYSLGFADAEAGGLRARVQPAGARSGAGPFVGWYIVMYNGQNPRHRLGASARRRGRRQIGGSLSNCAIGAEQPPVLLIRV